MAKLELKLTALMDNMDEMELLSFLYWIEHVNDELRNG
jgi:hypothetical protein